MSDLRVKPNTDNGDLPKDYKNITLETVQERVQTTKRV
jgi:hypothetical protein